MITIPLIPSDPPVVMTFPNGRRVRISGYCCLCGDCCESGNPYTGDHTPCPHFKRLSPEQGICTDRSEANSYYQHACRLWPSKPEHPLAYPRCTYVVEDVS
jgi:hypothetical protein